MPAPPVPSAARSFPGPPRSREPAFRHRRSLGDRLLAAGAGVERALRALVRRVASGRSPVRREDVARLTPSASAAARKRAAVLAGPQAAPASAAGPILYLPALPWAYRFQRPQQLAVALAEAGVPVVYVEAFLRTRLQPRVWVTAPAPAEAGADLRIVRLRVPGRPDPFREPLPPAAVQPLARLLIGGLPRPPRAVLAQLPFWAPLARTLAREAGVPLVYDRIDLHTAFPGVPAAVGAVEEEMVEACDLVTATSAALAELPRRLGVRTVLLPNAVDPGTIEPVPYRPDSEVASAGGPVAGMVGALDVRIDAAALAAAARALPGWHFRFAGRIEDPEVGRLAELPNVDLLGEIPHRRVPAFLAGLDVGLVPYRDTPLTRAIDPVKLYEMLAAGLPVALRRLPGQPPGGAAALSPPLVHPYEDPRDLPELLAHARAEDSVEVRGRRRAAAHEECWDRRAATLLAAIGSSVPAARRPVRGYRM